MKKVVMFVFLLICVPSVLADWFYNSQNILVNIDLSSEIEVVPLTSNGYVDTATVNMTFFPKQTGTQELLNFYTNPKGELTDKTLKFTWKMPEAKIGFKVNADVKTTNTITKIKEKITFPIQELPEDVAAYTKPSETIDSGNENIIRLASELVKGEDDLYQAVFKIADWTKNNINYNLSTLTAEVSQKASWVLENRQGVCDELTSLFIAMLRAVGIPARFVSGIAYTNSELFTEKWGPHGWAEVYFPGYGWLPFDATYGQLGWIDPTHVKFRDSVDSDEPSTYYNWLGRNADLKTRKLDIKTNLIDKMGYYRTPLKLEASVLKEAVNLGSFNLVEATIENLNDFYYATELHLSKPKEVKISGSQDKGILLLPMEKKKVFWIMKVDSNLESKYSYTFPLIVSSSNNISSQTSFTANVREKYVPLEEIGQTAKLLDEEKEKEYSGNVILDCKTEKSEFYEYEDAELYCNVRNTGNIFLEDVDVCFKNSCKRISLGISQVKNAAFAINKSEIGSIQSPVTARNELVSKVSYASFKINDAPKIEIEELEFPVNISYGDNFTISFTIAKKSYSNPKDVEIALALNGIEKKWIISNLTESRKFALRFEGKQLVYGNNNYKMDVWYYDGLKKEYHAYKEFSILLSNVNLMQRLLLLSNKVGSISWNTINTIIIMVIVAAIVFIFVVMVLFRRDKGMQ
ncbi:transglutaminase domain-containing protein [Candidatus Woesearchaeota archaeon]|nr:transglutaminase domain-containing protein [Candidatus Woesearchaeota archaeon]